MSSSNACVVLDVLLGTTTTGASSWTSSRIRFACDVDFETCASSSATTPGLVGADRGVDRGVDRPSSRPLESSFESARFAVARESPSTYDAHSATRRLRKTTRSDSTRANADAVAPSASSPGSNVSHFATTNASGVRDASVAARTIRLYGCDSGRRGSITSSDPMDASARIVEGKRLTAARVSAIFASATHPGPATSPSSSASSRSNATRSASTRARTDIATRDLPRSTAKDASSPSAFPTPLSGASPRRADRSPSIAGKEASAASVGRRTATESGPSAAINSASTPAYRGDDASRVLYSTRNAPPPTSPPPRVLTTRHGAPSVDVANSSCTSRDARRSATSASPAASRVAVARTPESTARARTRSGGRIPRAKYPAETGSPNENEPADASKVRSSRETRSGNAAGSSGAATMRLTSASVAVILSDAENCSVEGDADGTGNVSSAFDARVSRADRATTSSAAASASAASARLATRAAPFTASFHRRACSSVWNRSTRLVSTSAPRRAAAAAVPSRVPSRSSADAMARVAAATASVSGHATTTRLCPAAAFSDSASAPPASNGMGGKRCFSSAATPRRPEPSRLARNTSTRLPSAAILARQGTQRSLPNDIQSAIAGVESPGASEPTSPNASEPSTLVVSASVIAASPSSFRASCATTASSCLTFAGDTATRSAPASSVISVSACPGTGASAWRIVAFAPNAGMSGAASVNVDALHAAVGSHGPGATAADTSATEILNALKSLDVSADAPSSTAAQLLSRTRPRSTNTVAGSDSVLADGAATRGAWTSTVTSTTGRSASAASSRSRAAVACRLAPSATARLSSSSCSANCAGLCRVSTATRRSIGDLSAVTCAGATETETMTSGASRPVGFVARPRRSASEGRSRATEYRRRVPLASASSVDVAADANPSSSAIFSYSSSSSPPLASPFATSPHNASAVSSAAMDPRADSETFVERLAPDARTSLAPSTCTSIAASVAR